MRVVAVVAVGALGVSCSNDAPPDAGIAPPATALAAPELVQRLGDLVPGEGPARECVTARLDQDAALRERATSGVASDSPDARAIEELVDRCTGTSTLAPAFGRFESEKFGGLDDATVACLEEQFRALPSEKVDPILASGVRPPAGSPEQAILTELESSCRLGGRSTVPDTTTTTAVPGP